jgi:hypothetical protein
VATEIAFNNSLSPNGEEAKEACQFQFMVRKTLIKKERNTTKRTHSKSERPTTELATGNKTGCAPTPKSDYIVLPPLVEEQATSSYRIASLIRAVLRTRDEAKLAAAEQVLMGKPQVPAERRSILLYVKYMEDGLRYIKTTPAPQKGNINGKPGSN